MYLDMTYVYFVLPALLLAMWAQARVTSTFNRYSKITTQRNLTGRDAARKILDANGLHSVKIERIPGNLTDHYDPKAKVIRLSDSVYDRNSIGAVGVAAHEAGHAVQHSEGYMPIKLRNSVIPVANIGSYLAFPLAILGILVSNDLLINTGIILFSAIVLFQLVTLPVEFNASNRAVTILARDVMLNRQEVHGVKKVLSAAAMTYVAAAATAVMNLVRLLVLVNRNRD
ncbi:MAG: zinc metallopeptidase [Ruminococcaceae bacterium]|nr:zinc metallopeptidase [Oscillospiraceae bacterium]